ncbi:MAG: hypothetical protein B7Z44_02165, partial [Caulobacter sp. 12-67-6]
MQLELINRTFNNAVLAGVELLRVNAGGAAEASVALQVSVDDGTSWRPIAGDLPVDAQGGGRYLWTV